MFKLNNIPVKVKDITFIAVATLLLSVPSGFTADHFAKVMFAGSFLQTFAYTIPLAALTARSTLWRNVALSMIVVLFALEVYVFTKLGCRINANILSLILQTNANEAWEYLNLHVLSIGFFISIITIAAATTAICVFINKLNAVAFTIGKKSIIATAVVLALFIAYTWMPKFAPIGKNSIHNLVNSMGFVVDSHNDIALYEQMIDRIEITHYPDSNQSPAIVLIVGESFNRNHSNLYGYPLNTQPRLKAEADSGNLLVFTNCTTPSLSTNKCIKFLFTHSRCTSADEDKETSHIIMPAVFRRAGFRVSYLDNQYTRTFCQYTDFTCGYFLNPPKINDACFDVRNDELCPYDGDFVDRYGNEIQTAPGTLSIIHIMGQHFDSSQRYPEEFDAFHADVIDRRDLSESQREQVAQYDNATLYNDYTISKIIDRYRNSDAVIIYIADHGEQIYDGPNHYFGRGFLCSFYDDEPYDNIFRIPVMIWMSPTFSARHSDAALRLRNAVDRQFCSDDLPFLLYDLAGIDFNYNDKSRSLIHDLYIPHKTIIAD